MNTSRVPPHSPQPLSEWPAAERAAITGVITDIDDTLTRDGHLMPQALQALQQLQAAGVPVLAVTGRSVGWCLPGLEGQPVWPVKGIVAENGAVALCRGHDGQVLRRYREDEATRRDHAQRLQFALADVEARVPGAQRAADSAGRETDIAIDWCEHHHLDPEQVQAVVDVLRGHGLTVTVSSIHVNAWVGSHDKWTGACWAVNLWLQRSLVDELDRWVFVGDSANDVVMFEKMRHSVGVANVAPFLARLAHRPRYLSIGERGQGFAELAQALLDGR